MVSTTDQLLNDVHRSGLAPLTGGCEATTLQSTEGRGQFSGDFLIAGPVQNLMTLGADTELSEICDQKDVTIAVLEGEGQLKLNQEIIPLEPEQLVFIPALLPHTIQAQTNLTVLLSRCEPDPSSSDSAWLITL